MGSLLQNKNWEKPIRQAVEHNDDDLSQDQQNQW